MALELMRSGTDVAVLEDSLNLMLYEIRDANVLCQASTDELLHRERGVEDRDALIYHGALLVRIECNGPMHEIEIQVVDAEI